MERTSSILENVGRMERYRLPFGGASHCFRALRLGLLVGIALPLMLTEPVLADGSKATTRPEIHQIPAGGANDGPEDCEIAGVIKQPSEPELVEQIALMKVQLEAIKGLEGEDLVRKIVALDIADPTIQRYYPQFLDILIEVKNAEASGFGVRHPTRQVLQMKLDTLTDYITRAAEDVRETLSMRIEQAEWRLERRRVAPAGAGERN